MPRGVMLIADIPEKPDLVLPGKQGEAEGVDGRVAVAFIEEATAAIQVFEEPPIGLGAKEGQGADLEITEELTVVVLHAVVRVEQPVDVGVGVDQVRVLGDEVASDAPERGEAAGVVEDGHVEAVDEVVLGQEPERVVGDVAEEMHVRFHAPVPVVRVQCRVLVEEPRLPSYHRVVAQHVPFAHSDRTKVV